MHYYYYYYVMEKILLILVPGYTYLYIIQFENTYIFIICHKKWNYSMLKKFELFGSVFLWLIIFVKKTLKGVVAKELS